MFDNQGLYFDVFEDDGTLFIKISGELIVHVLDLRKRLTVRDLTEDFVSKLIKMMFEGSPADNADRLRRLWQAEDGTRVLLKVLLAPPDKLCSNDGEPLPAGIEVGFFMGLHTLSRSDFRGLLKRFKRCESRTIVG